MIENDGSIEIPALGGRPAPTAPEEVGLLQPGIDSRCGIVPNGIVIRHDHNLLDLSLDSGSDSETRPLRVNRICLAHRLDQAETEHSKEQHHHRDDGCNWPYTKFLPHIWSLAPQCWRLGTKSCNSVNPELESDGFLGLFTGRIEKISCLCA